MFREKTNAWEQRKLGEISRMYQPLTITGNDLLPDGVPVFGANGFIGFFSEANHIEDQVTISARGEGTGTPSYVHGPVWITGNSMVVNVDDFDINKYFLFANLTANSLKKYVTGGAQPQLTRDVLVKVPITLPNADEQQKIGSFFQQLDNTITLHQRQYDSLKKAKQGFLQKMFPKKDETKPEIRFAGFTDAWEQCKWIDTVDMSTNMVDPKTGKYDKLLHIGPGNIESFTGRILDNVNTVKDDNLISGKFHFNPNDIIYGKINPQLAKYTHVNFEGLASADAYVLNSKNEITQDFLYVELQTSEFYKYSVSVSMRTGMPKINRDELNQFSYLAPKNIEEQQKIGVFFKQLDSTITLHQRKLNDLKKIKKAMLQKMFI